MSDRMPPDDEKLFEAVVMGTIELDSTEVRERARSSPALAAALDDWRALDSRLRTAKEEERASLARAIAQTTDEDRRLVRELARPRIARGSRARLVQLLLAAAAVLVVFLAARAWLDESPGDRPDGLLGNFGCLRPRDVTDGFRLFEVDAAVPRWQSLVIIVRDSAGTELARSPRLSAPRWEPAPEVVERLEGAGTIEWSFELRDAGGELASSGGPCRAWLSR